MNQYTIQQFIVDAFTDTVFKGNPAVSCTQKLEQKKSNFGVFLL